MKYLSVILIIVNMLFLPCRAETKTETEIETSVSMNTSFTDEFAEASVVLSENGGFVAYQVDLLYGSEILQPYELKGGIAGVPVYNFKLGDDGEPVIKTAYAGTSAVKENGVLFTVRFRLSGTESEKNGNYVRFEKVCFFTQDGQKTEVKIISEDDTVDKGQSDISYSVSEIEEEIILPGNNEKNTAAQNQTGNSSDTYQENYPNEFGSSLNTAVNDASDSDLDTEYSNCSGSESAAENAESAANVLIKYCAVFLLLAGMAAVIVMLKAHLKK